MKKLTTLYLAVSIFSTIGLAQMTHAAVVLGTVQGYEASVSGSIPVFLVLSDHDAFAANSGEQAARIQSGFNPANVTFHVKAPTTDGLTISAHVQYDTHLQGSGTQNSGLLESRVAEIQLDGAFGSVSLGKGFGIFNSSAIGDVGSGLGVGWLGGGADTANATGGHIGTGYVYANFNPHISYASPDFNGFNWKVGAINPEDPAGYDTKKVETNMPRLEGQMNYLVDYSRGELALWSGFMYQTINLMDKNYDYQLSGIDVGMHLKMDNLGVRLAYTDTKGIGADGLYGFGGINDAEVKASQWYGELTYVQGKTTIGASYGEGQQDATTTPVGAALAVTNKLGMVFVHHKLTPAFTVIGELQDYRSDAQAAYNAYVVGAQFDF